MKIIKKENVGIHSVYNTNVEEVHNYIGNSVINHNCVVDSGYMGEIHLSLINTSNDTVKISTGMKILQFIEMPIFDSDISLEKTSLSKFYETQTERGSGGFGSSDNK